MSEWVSLNDIYNAYVDCRKRKRNTDACAIFEINEANNIYTLWEELNNGTYKIGFSNAFCVTRPKVREVFAADFRDRIVHHLLIQKTGALFEAYFTQSTFNCRKGYGTNAAHVRALEYAKQYADGWVLSCDIKGFFMAIPKAELANRLEAFLRARYTGTDLEQIVWLTRMVVLHEPQRRCIKKGDLNLWQLLPKEKSLFTCGDGLGMAIGNLTSQIYANFYLADFDHWIEMQNVGYCRYVDDFKIFAHDRQTLLRLLPAIRNYLRDYSQLTLHPHKLVLQQVRKGFKFVGVSIKGGNIRIGNRTVGNAIDMIRRYNYLTPAQMEPAVDKYVSRYNSYAGYMMHYQTYAIRWRVWVAVDEHVKRFVYITNNMCTLKARTKYRTITILKQHYYDLRKHTRGRIQGRGKKQST